MQPQHRLYKQQLLLPWVVPLRLYASCPTLGLVEVGGAVCSLGGRLAHITQN